MLEIARNRVPHSSAPSIASGFFQSPTSGSPQSISLSRYPTRVPIPTIKPPLTSAPTTQDPPPEYNTPVPSQAGPKRTVSPLDVQKTLALSNTPGLVQSKAPGPHQFGPPMSPPPKSLLSHPRQIPQPPTPGPTSQTISLPGNIQRSNPRKPQVNARNRVPHPSVPSNASGFFQSPTSGSPQSISLSMYPTGVPIPAITRPLTRAPTTQDPPPEHNTPEPSQAGSQKTDSSLEVQKTPALSNTPGLFQSQAPGPHQFSPPMSPPPKLLLSYPRQIPQPPTPGPTNHTISLPGSIQRSNPRKPTCPRSPPTLPPSASLTHTLNDTLLPSIHPDPIRSRPPPTLPPIAGFNYSINDPLESNNRPNTNPLATNAPDAKYQLPSIEDMISNLSRTITSLRAQG